jgi:hypothetical protein
MRWHQLYASIKLDHDHLLWLQINWTKYFDTILPDDVHSYIATNPDIIVNEVGYLQNLTKLLVDTDERVIVNYVLWRFVSSSVGVLDTRYDDVEQVYDWMLYVPQLSYHLGLSSCAHWSCTKVTTLERLCIRWSVYSSCLTIDYRIDQFIGIVNRCTLCSWIFWQDW